MNTEVGGGARSLKSITNLITAALVCVALAALVGVAGYFLGVDLLYVGAGAVLVCAAIPLFLMQFNQDIQRRR